MEGIRKAKNRSYQKYQNLSIMGNYPDGYAWYYDKKRQDSKQSKII